MVTLFAVIKWDNLFHPFDFGNLGFNCGEAANIATPEWLSSFNIVIHTLFLCVLV